MKIIDLLNKIANGEEIPKKIRYGDLIYNVSDVGEDYYNYEYVLSGKMKRPLTKISGQF